ncbi:hypothetical protein [Paenibacillus sp. 1P07SE]|uniref:hypothetical protein n=1 Tax=Paenibacillus sp. 1P07SE TaxID=3132209 RepID=UPI0039A74242
MKHWPLRAVTLLPLILLLACSDNAVIEMPEENRQELISRITDASMAVQGYSSTNVAEPSKNDSVVLPGRAESFVGEIQAK